MKKKSTIFSIFLLGIILFNLGLTTVIASDDDFDGIDDDLENLNKRDIEIDFSGDEFEVQTILRTGALRDSIKFSVSYDNEGLNIELQYESEFEGDDQNNEDDLNRNELEFSISFRKLIEFVDMDTNGIYDDSVDQTIQEVEIKDFKPIKYSQINVSLDTILHYIIFC